MSFASNLPVQTESTSSGEKQPKRLNHKEHRKAVIRSAKNWLIGMFLSMRALDVTMLVGSRLFKISSLVCVLALLGIWTTPFLVAIWRRQAWAVYTLAAFIFLCVVAAAIGAVHLVSENGNEVSELYPFIGTAAGYVVIAAVLLRSKDIERLVSKAYQQAGA